MIVKYDSFNRFELPKFTLCKPSSRYVDGMITDTIGILSFTSDEEIVANFNAVSDLNFVCYKVSDEDDPDNLYSKLSEKQAVYVDDIGFFCITEIREHVAEDKVYKDVTAQSCETEIRNKTMPGEFYAQESNLDYAYNTTFEFNALIELLVRAIPGWSLAHVDSSLMGVYRTFEDISEDTNILSFMLTNMQDAYECIFTFDTKQRLIYVYAQNNYVHMTDIHLTYRDVVESLTMTSSSDDLYTALNVTGDGNLNITGVNPLGTNVLYKYNHFFESMLSALSTKVATWQSLVESYESSYYTYNTQYYTKLGERSTAQSSLGSITSQLEMYQRCRENIVAASEIKYRDSLCYVSGNEKVNQIANITTEYNNSGATIVVVPTHVDTLTISDDEATTTATASGTAGSEIVALYVKDSEGIYTQSLTQSSSATEDHFTYDPSNNKLTFHTGQFADGTAIAVFYHPTDPSVDEDAVIITDLIDEIDAIIGGLQFDQQTEADAIAALDSELSTIKADIDAIHSAVAMDTYFTNSELSSLSLYTFEGDYTDEYVTTTDSMTPAQQLAQSKVLYDRAVSQLTRIATPTQQFDLDVESFIFQKEFQDWAEQLETGCLINVELEQNDVAQLFLSNFTVNYADASLSMTFGNRYNKYDQQTLFNDVLGKINRTSNSINFVKDTLYPITSGEFNEIKRALSQMRILSAGQAIASEYQDFVIDSTGITGKQRSGDDGFNPEQIKIVNNMLALTDDNWETCKVAIGKILLNDGSYKYGVNAEVLMGEILIGNELHILGQNMNGEYVDIFSVMQERIEAHVPEIHAVTTNTGYTFNDNGLMIERADSEIINVLDNEGMEISLVNNSTYEETLQCANNSLTLTYPAIDASTISITINGTAVTNYTYDATLHKITIISPEYSDGAYATVSYEKGTPTAILTAKNDGVRAKNLIANEYLQAGLHSRFENFATTADANRTACFYI